MSSQALTNDPLPVHEAAYRFAQSHWSFHSARWGQAGLDARALFEPAGAAGLLGMQVPRSFGGQAWSFADMVKALQALARVDFSAAMALVNSHNVAAQLVNCSPEVLAPRYLPGLLSGQLVSCTALTEPGTGSDLAQLQTLAQRHGDGWVLNGSKTWIINAEHADHVVVYAQTQAGAGVKGIAAFYVDAKSPGFERTPLSTSTALKAMGLGGFRLSNVACDASQLLIGPGAAFVDIMGAINRARIYVAAMCCGMVSQALADAVSYGQQRQTFGKALPQHQGWRWQMAQVATALEASECLVARACEWVEQGVEVQAAAAQAKLHATHMAQTQLGSLLQAMGAEGFLDRHVFLRHLTAAHAAALTDGSTAMLLERVAADLHQSAAASAQAGHGH